jgi:hypothetical protein
MEKEETGKIKREILWSFEEQKVDNSNELIREDKHVSMV